MRIRAKALSLSFGLALVLGVGNSWAQNTAAASAPNAELTAEQARQFDATRKKLETEFSEMQIDGIRSTPFADMLEVQVGKNLFYTNPEVDYIFQGALIDVAQRTDLTAERLAYLNRIDFASLPLDKAITYVKGDGSRQVAVFEDPNCQFCKRLHTSLEDVDNVTVHFLMYPILSLDSIKKAEHIWCADDQIGTLRDWMVNNKTPQTKTCENPVASIVEFGSDLGIRGTPAIIFEDGSQVGGWLPGNELAEKIDAAAVAVAQ